MTEPLVIIDPHIHLWDLSTGLYPDLETPSTGFIGDNAAIARSYLLDEFLDEAPVGIAIQGAVHVEAFPTDPLAEVAHLQWVADASPIPIGVVANADLSAPDIEPRLEALASHPAFRGIRQVLNRHRNPLYNYVDRDFMDLPAWHSGFGLLARFGASFDLQLYPHQAGPAAAIAGKHPGVQVVVNHAGMWVDRDLDGWRQWRDGMRVLAREPNVAIKISGLGMFDHQWTLDSIGPLVFEVLDAFGVGRTMFASNFPVDKLFSSYADLWQAFSAVASGLNANERHALFCGNARRLYRL